MASPTPSNILVTKKFQIPHHLFDILSPPAGPRFRRRDMLFYAPPAGYGPGPGAHPRGPWKTPAATGAGRRGYSKKETSGPARQGAYGP